MSLLDRVFASQYERGLAASEREGLAAMRAEVLAGLDGAVVEVGAGTGLNLAHVPQAVTRWVATEPEPHMAEQLRARAAADPRVEVVDAPAEALPLADASMDHGVAVLVLCTVGDLEAAVAELARVVRPGGTLAVVEHVRASTTGTAVLQRVVQPLWKVGARGCHLTRDPREVLAAHGFDVTALRPWRVPAAPGIVAPAVVGRAPRA